MKERMNQLMAHHTGQTVETVTADTERDNFMTAKDALGYGIVDRIVESRMEEVNVASAGAPAAIPGPGSDNAGNDSSET